MRKILFRADGSTEIGLGHVIRSLALAEMLKDQFICAFAIQEPGKTLYNQIAAVCREVVILPKTSDKAELEQELNPYLNGFDLIVLDGYKFDTSYQRKIKERGLALVCIDDIHAYHFVADIVINHGITDSSVYSSEPYTRMLLGTDYCLLRTPFQQQMKGPFVTKEAGSVFLCFGGADATDLTGKYLKWLLSSEGVKKIHVVVGSAYMYEEDLKKLLELRESKIVEVHRNISAHELVEIIQRTQFAIVPGSTIAIECASAGIPMICGSYVDNQLDVVQMFAQKGLAVTVGDFSSLEKEEFIQKVQFLLQNDALEWHKRSCIFFDGKAKERLQKAFCDVFLMRSIRLRRAGEFDVTLFYQWANDLAVRQNAIQKEPILFENHYRWYMKKMQSHRSFIYVATLDKKDFGQVRFDHENETFVIDYSISSEMRGKGLAGPMLNMAIQRLQSETLDLLPLKAMVKSTNIASKKVFEKLDFCFRGTEMINAEEYNVFEKEL